MSAPLRLDADALGDIANALNDLEAVAAAYGVRIGAYGDAHITHHQPDGGVETVLRISYTIDEDDVLSYRIDDRVGE